MPTVQYFSIAFWILDFWIPDSSPCQRPNIESTAATKTQCVMCHCVTNFSRELC
jgi:hypothetical protein